MVYSTKKFDRKKREGNAPPPPQGGSGIPREGAVPLHLQEEILGIGLRYDFHEQASLKVQIDHVRGMEDDPQLLLSDNQDNRKATVLTFTIDMVF
jgi:hypothetical protein